MVWVKRSLSPTGSVNLFVGVQPPSPNEKIAAPFENCKAKPQVLLKFMWRWGWLRLQHQPWRARCLLRCRRRRMDPSVGRTCDRPWWAVVDDGFASHLVLHCFRCPGLLSFVSCTLCYLYQKRFTLNVAMVCIQGRPVDRKRSCCALRPIRSCMLSASDEHPK
jgi:hypothetical protein